MGKTFTIEKLKSAPKAFVGLTEKVNQLIKAVKVLSEMKGDGNINVKVTDSNVLFSLGGVGRGGGDTQPSSFTGCPLRLSLVQPDDYPDPPNETDDFLWVEFGTLNQIPVTGIVSPVSAIAGQYIYVKATTNATDENWTLPFKVTAAELVGSSSVLTDTGASPTKPASIAYFLLGQIGTAPNGDLFVANNGCGNLTLSLVGQGIQCVVADAGDSEADPPRPAMPAGTKTVYQAIWSRG